MCCSYNSVSKFVFWDCWILNKNMVFGIKPTWDWVKVLPTHNLNNFFFFFTFIFISWRLITLQYCCGICHTLTWISHGFTCIPHPDPPCHLPLYPIPLGLPSAPGPNTFSCIQPGLVICFTLDNIHVSMLFSWNIPPLPSPTESKSLFCISVSLYLFCI